MFQYPTDFLEITENAVIIEITEACGLPVFWNIGNKGSLMLG